MSPQGATMSSTPVIDPCDGFAAGLALLNRIFLREVAVPVPDVPGRRIRQGISLDDSETVSLPVFARGELKTAIINMLARDGARTVDELAVELGYPPGCTRIVQLMVNKLVHKRDIYRCEGDVVRFSLIQL